MGSYPHTKDQLYQEFYERLTGHHKHQVGIPNTSKQFTHARSVDLITNPIFNQVIFIKDVWVKFGM